MSDYTEGQAVEVRLPTEGAAFSNPPGELSAVAPAEELDLPSGDAWYDGVIQQVRAGGLYDVELTDPEWLGTQRVTVPAERVRRPSTS